MNWIRTTVDERKLDHVIYNLLIGYEDELCDKFNIISIPTCQRYMYDFPQKQKENIMEWLDEMIQESELVYEGLLQLSKKSKKSTVQKYKYYYNYDLNMVVVQESESGNINTAFKHSNTREFVDKQLDAGNFAKALLCKGVNYGK